MNISSFIGQVSERSANKEPFFFLVDFELEAPLLWSMGQLTAARLQFNFEGFGNDVTHKANAAFMEKAPPSFEAYARKFDKVKSHLQAGNSFLVNLTDKTEIFTAASLEDFYHSSKAKYKILFDNRWVVFSPETFVRIVNGQIETCPMKGTIDASLPNAQQTLLDDPKELAEHVTVVDLLRNDLSRYCTEVTVENFRYAEIISTSRKDLVQTSTKITGKLPDNYRSNLGEILIGLLPAGSICGAPKPKTLEIIRETESEKRGYYTGIAGHFDGENLNSCVLIRFIEKDGDRMYYRSGGGVTAQSVVGQEYQELIDKVYVPATGVY